MNGNREVTDFVVRAKPFKTMQEGTSVVGFIGYEETGENKVPFPVISDSEERDGFRPVGIVYRNVHKT